MGLHILSDFGGKGIRTPDFQLAKLALYQLSYAPAGIADCRLKIADCKNSRPTRPPLRNSWIPGFEISILKKKKRRMTIL